MWSRNQENSFKYTPGGGCLWVKHGRFDSSNFPVSKVECSTISLSSCDLYLTMLDHLVQALKTMCEQDRFLFCSCESLFGVRLTFKTQQ